MKNIYIFLILMVSVSVTSSCNKWLDVNPKAEIKAETLFETKEGFANALTGLYINLSSEHAYSKELSWCALDYMACYYPLPAGSGTYYRLQKYDYTDPKTTTIIDTIWSRMYNVVAETNYLLRACDNYGKKFNLVSVKAQCYAVRALCHFDLIRLFAKGNLTNKSAALDELTIPYVSDHNKAVTPQRTYRQTLELLHQDIQTSIELFNRAGIEPELGSARYERPFYHFNKLAAELLNARVYMWEGNTAQAAVCAKNVITAYEKYVKSDVFYWMINNPYFTSTSTAIRDYVSAGELLLGLDVTNLSDLIEYIYSASKFGNVNYDRLSMSEATFNELYTIPGEGDSDMRKLYWFAASADNKINAVKISNTTGYYFANIIPLMRISEAYLIAAECSIGTDNAAAAGYINTVKTNRNIKPEYMIATTATAVQLREAITSEYRKEFISEGQLFFYYKRLGLKTFKNISFNGEMSDKQYVMPMPEIEKQLGYRQ